MKKYLLGLLWAAFASTAWAQGPTPVQTLPAAPIIQASIRQQACPPVCAPACPQVCVTPTKTVCMPEQAIKVTIKPVYSSVCEKVCFPGCSLSGLFGHHCKSGCENGNCEHHVYQKKYLVKKLCVTEDVVTKCVPVVVPDCAPRHVGLHRPACATAACPTPAPVGEPIPPPTKKMP